jgi:3-methylfumaryl-CoA hydratase
VPLPRRMWAGGRLRWETGNPLCVGEAATRHSRIASVTHKSGRNGELLFVTVVHEVHNARGLAITEEQDIVYRGAPRFGDPLPAATRAPGDALWQREWVPDELLLFRYSALTFNGHRIHYDRPYATQVEGYPGLVVQGPLLATFLADLVQRGRAGTRLRRFGFKAVRATFDLNPFLVCGTPSSDGKSAQLWSQDHEGLLTMQAEAQFD